MTIELHKKARVAGTGPGFIAPAATAGGDALPLTHTHPEATPSQKVAWHPQPPPPRRFTAINLPATPTVISMTTVVLILTTQAITTVTGSRIDLVQVLSAVAGLTIAVVVMAVVSALVGRWPVRWRSMSSHTVAVEVFGDPWLGGWDYVDDGGSEFVVLGRFVTAEDRNSFEGGPRPGGRRPEPGSPQREGVRPGAPPKAASRAALGNTENSLPFPADDEEAHQ